MKQDRSKHKPIDNLNIKFTVQRIIFSPDLDTSQSVGGWVVGNGLREKSTGVVEPMDGLIVIL